MGSSGGSATAEGGSAVDTRNLLTTGEETLLRDFCTANPPTSTGHLRLTYWTSRKTETSTQARLYSVTAAGATPTLCRWGVYQIAANGDGTLVASIPNDTALFATANTAYTRSWSAPWAKVAGVRYAFGLLIVTGAATPTFLGATLGASSTGGAEALLAPKIASRLDGQSDLPASFADASLNVSSSRVYAAILP